MNRTIITASLIGAFMFLQPRNEAAANVRPEQAGPYITAVVKILDEISKYLVGKEILDRIWDPLTGRPDVRRLEAEIQTIEGVLKGLDSRLSQSFADLRNSVTSQTSAAEYQRLVRQAVDKSTTVAQLEERVNETERRSQDQDRRLRNLEQAVETLLKTQSDNSGAQEKQEGAARSGIIDTPIAAAQPVATEPRLGQPTQSEPAPPAREPRQSGEDTQFRAPPIWTPPLPADPYGIHFGAFATFSSGSDGLGQSTRFWDLSGRYAFGFPRADVVAEFGISRHSAPPVASDMLEHELIASGVIRLHTNPGGRFELSPVFGAGVILANAPLPIAQRTNEQSRLYHDSAALVAGADVRLSLVRHVTLLGGGRFYVRGSYKERPEAFRRVLVRPMVGMEFSF